MLQKRMPGRDPVHAVVSERRLFDGETPHNEHDGVKARGRVRNGPSVLGLCTQTPEV